MLFLQKEESSTVPYAVISVIKWNKVDVQFCTLGCFARWIIDIAEDYQKGGRLDRKTMLDDLYTQAMKEAREGA